MDHGNQQSVLQYIEVPQDNGSSIVVAIYYARGSDAWKAEDTPGNYMTTGLCVTYMNGNMDTAIESDLYNGRQNGEVLINPTTGIDYEELNTALPALGHGNLHTVQEFINGVSGTARTQLEGILTDIDNKLISKGFSPIDRNLKNSACVRWVENFAGVTCTLNIFIEQTEIPEDDIMLFIYFLNGEIWEVKSVTTTTVKTSTAKQLRDTIATWYFNLRNLALLVLMLILIYIGIRIVVGSTAGDKAKYKERLMDWLVAICLLFIMHYIMAFAVQLTEKIIELIDNVRNYEGIVALVPLNDNQINYIEDDIQEQRDEYKAFQQMGTIVEKEGVTYLAWTTDLLGKIKIASQTTQEGTANWVGYALCYVVLVLETLFFAWTYIKRVLYMAFLTIIAPMVAMTYPIDKLTDGKAQAFSSWLKEYLFNLLIQPLHLLLYTILVTAAYKLAKENPVYAIVAVGFIMPAEKMVRSFFGFNKAKTPGALGGAAGAALAYTGLQKMMNWGKNTEKHKNNNSEKDNGKIKFSKQDSVNPKETIAKHALGSKDSAVGPGKDDGKLKLAGDKSKGNDTAKEANPIKTNDGAGKGADFARTATTDGTVVTRPPVAQTGAKKLAPNEKKKEAPEGEKKKRSILRASGAVTKRYGRLMGQKLTNKINNTNLLRSAARGVAGVYGATAMGMAGLALGVASGDASKAFQYTTAGVTGGYAAGKGLGGAAYDTLSVDSGKIKDEMEMAYYGEDYKSIKFEEDVQKMVHDEKNIDSVRKLRGVSYEEAQEILTTTGRDCFAAGVTDVQDIAAVNKMENSGYSREQAIAASKFSQYLPKDMSESDRDSFMDRWTREYEEKGYDNSRQLAEESMRLAEVIKKMKSGMTEA